MNVTLKQNSWHFKLYSKVIDDNPPKTLCPYFWSLVAILLFSPILLTMLLIKSLLEGIEYLRKSITPVKVEPEKSFEERLDEMRKQIAKDNKREERRMKTLNVMVGVGSLLFKWVVLPSLAIGIIYTIFVTGNSIGWLQLLLIVGAVLGFILIIFGFVWTIDTYGNKIIHPIGKVLRKLNPIKWSITQIIGGMIYATYVKACPVIQWEEKVSKEEQYGTN